MWCPFWQLTFSSIPNRKIAWFRLWLYMLVGYLSIGHHTQNFNFDDFHLSNGPFYEINWWHTYYSHFFHQHKLATIVGKRVHLKQWNKKLLIRKLFHVDDIAHEKLKKNWIILEVVHWYTSIGDTKNGILLIHRIHESDKIHGDDLMSAMPKIRLPSKRTERVEQTKITSWTIPFVLSLFS